MKWLLWKLGIVTLVWTIDYDGEVRKRIVRMRDDSERVVFGIIRATTGILRPDGEIWGGCYMTSWRPYKGIGSRPATPKTRKPKLLKVGLPISEQPEPKPVPVTTTNEDWPEVVHGKWMQ